MCIRDRYTDFAIHADGFSRMLLLTDRIAPRRLGRLVQRLLEIETYRMAALLGLPAARDVSAVLASAERELAELAQSLSRQVRITAPVSLRGPPTVSIQLPDAATSLLRRDDVDTVYYQVLGVRGEFLSGDFDLPVPDAETLQPDTALRFREIRGNSLRVHCPSPATRAGSSHCRLRSRPLPAGWSASPEVSLRGPSSGGCEAAHPPWIGLGIALVCSPWIESWSRGADAMQMKGEQLLPAPPERVRDRSLPREARGFRRRARTRPRARGEVSGAC